MRSSHSKCIDPQVFEQSKTPEDPAPFSFAKSPTSDHDLAQQTHRFNNTLAVIRALVNIGEATAPDVKSFASTLRNQIEALTAATHLTSQIPQGQSDARVSLASIISAALGTDALADNDGLSVQTDCSPDIALEPDDLSHLAMILFELAGATKSDPQTPEPGRLEVSAKANVDGTIQVTWAKQNKGGGASIPSEVKPTFGATVLGLCASNLAANYTNTVTEDGMVFQIQMRQQA
ncbi:MAG: HWE histidine kinase domain-containing protein [Pseudomonadota bacterium]